jgi:hypothetical protein
VEAVEGDWKAGPFVGLIAGDLQGPSLRTYLETRDPGRMFARDLALIRKFAMTRRLVTRRTRADPNSGVPAPI